MTVKSKTSDDLNEYINKFNTKVNEASYVP